MDGLQILVAASYHNKRPATKDLDGVWPAPVLKLMKEMWNSNPMDRPSMVEARDLLRSVVVQNQCRVTPVSGSEAVGLRRLTNSSLENSSSSKKIDFSIVFN